MRGQVFTMDLFVAYGVFLVIMLLISAMGLWVSTTIREKDLTDAMSSKAIAGLDYLCYSGNYSYAPYQLNKTAVDGFFSQGDSIIRNELGPGWDYSMKLLWLNGTEIEAAGSYDHSADKIMSFSRLVDYDGVPAKLVMSIWMETEVLQ